jgi:hypothetical protein
MSNLQINCSLVSMGDIGKQFCHIVGKKTGIEDYLYLIVHVLEYVSLLMFWFDNFCN